MLAAVTRRIDSETLYMPEIGELVGQEVEIVVSLLPVAVRTGVNPLKGSVIEYEDPFPLRGSILRDEDPLGPVAEDDWEAVK